MRIYVSDFSDFCFGVKRAIRISEDVLRSGAPPVYSLGAIIHNRDAVKRLARKGLKVLEGDLAAVKKGSVIICSHGIHPGRLKAIKKDVAIIDATCPFVKNAQEIAAKLFRLGYKVVIVGDKGHPEVRSLKRFAGNRAAVVSSVFEAVKFGKKADKIGVLAQTTQAGGDFRSVLAELMKKGFKEFSVFNTICRDAELRQKAAEDLAGKSDIVIVAGGRDSANTRRLYDICKKTAKDVYHIERASGLKNTWLRNKKSVAVVSGASTPRWVVDEIVAKLERRKENK